MHTENSREIPLQVGKFNHGREFRFVVVNVNIEIEAAGREMLSGCGSVVY